MRKSDLSINPIIINEIRSRMRGWRAFATLTSALLFLGIFSYTIYRMAVATARYSTTPLSPLIGQTVFAGLAFLELVLVCAITPAITAGAISGEKEKLTFEMLLATPLHPASVLWGKLVSALSYVLLLIFAAVPMASLVFIFGGVNLRDMLKALLVLAAVAVMLGVIGLFMSTLFGRSGRAIALTYVIAALMMFGPMFVSIGVATIRQTDPPRLALFPSPLSALSSALSPSVSADSLSSMFWMFGNMYWFTGSPPISQTSIPRPIYHYSLPFYGAITLVLYFLSTRLIRPSRRWRIHWSEGLLGLVLLLGYAGLVAVAFGTTSNRYENINFQVTTPTPVPAIVEPSSQVNPAPVSQETSEPPSDFKQPSSETPTIKNTVGPSSEEIAPPTETPVSAVIRRNLFRDETCFVWR